ncbi:MAG: recombinase family protein, partial [Anaerolineales bacterium]
LSTKKQLESYSPASHLRECREYCVRAGWEVVAELVDAISGAKVAIEDRPEGAKLYDYILNGSVDVVVLPSHDRTARDEWGLEYILIKQAVYENGLQLHFADAGIDPPDFASNIIGNIKSQMAARENQLRAKRSKDGKDTKARLGQWVGNSDAPYGYSKIGEKKTAQLVINPEEAAIVRRIFEDYTGWVTGESKKLVQIAAELTAEGVPLPNRNGRPGAGWWKNTLGRIIIRKLYIGVWEYNGMQVPFPELAIIEPELWQAAQVQRGKNKLFSKRNGKLEYLLQGRFKCQCGLAMGGMSMAGRKYLYYGCGRRFKPHLSTCKTRFVRADLVDRIGWDWVQKLLLDETELENALEEMAARKEAYIAPKRARLAEVTKRIDDTSRQMRGVMSDLRALGDSPGPARAMLQADLAALDRSVAGWADERDRLTRELEAKSLSADEIELIRRQADIFRRKLQGKPNHEQKKRLLDILDFSAEYREEADGSRWLDMACGLVADPETVLLDNYDLRNSHIHQYPAH